MNPTTERKRLHITPFNPGSLPTILSKDLLQRASNISFHTIQSSPESNFGYIDLPIMDADKLKKKLNGSILRGTRMHVEDARPAKSSWKSTEDNAVEDTVVEDTDSLRNKSKRQGKDRVKSSQGVTVGFELPEGRKVQRGWTNPTSTSKSMKSSMKLEQKQSKTGKSKASKFSQGPECLFKTRLPSNVVDIANSPTEIRLRRRKTHDSVVHEFSKTKRHTVFLRDSKHVSDKKRALEYVEAKGWVDEDGTVIDQGPRKRLRQSELAGNNSGTSGEFDKGGSSESGPHLSVPGSQPNSCTESLLVNDETSSSGTSSASDSDNNTEAEVGVHEASSAVTQSIIPDDDGESEISSKEDQPCDSESLAQQANYASVSSRLSTRSEDSTEPHKSTQENSRKVHPLESLFKRPVAASSTLRKPTLEVSTSFSFFDQAAEKETNNSLLMPQTPFTQQDFRERRQRSAAPTPDTAAPGKTFGDVWAGGVERRKDKEEEDTKSGLTTQEMSESVPESDFSKWFWEHRGETNRAWKRRRREVAKEKRQRGNKRP